MARDHDPIPLYHRIKTAIRQAIEEGKLRPGDQLPPERALVEQYHVSRITIRQALGELAQEGLLTRQQGRGTFVTPQKLAQPLMFLTGFTEELAERGIKPAVRVIAVRTIAPPPEVAGYLHLPAGEKVVFVERILSTDSRPLLLDTRYLPSHLGISLPSALLMRQSIYSLLEQAGFRPFAADQTIEAVAAGTREAKLLDVKTGTPLLLIKRVTVDDTGAPLEYATATYRGDRYRYIIRLQRHNHFTGE